MADPLFHEPGPIPDALTFLKHEYIALLRKPRVDTAFGVPATVTDIPAELDKLQYFLNFCRQYLTDNRPCEIQHADMNYILKLTNGQSFLVSPGTEVVRGSMQPAHAVAVTGARDIVVDVTTPPAELKRIVPLATQDMSQPTGPKSYDK